ncbi:MAG: hypothetical protein AAGJ82_08880, partial [Bacteroidota bacterium]
MNYNLQIFALSVYFILAHTLSAQECNNPICVPAISVNLDCTERPAALVALGDVNDAYNSNFMATSATLTDLFGTAMGTADCPADSVVELAPEVNLNECGYGMLWRNFETWHLRPEGDANNNGQIDIEEVDRSTNVCRQEITVAEVHDFVIDFPADIATDCLTDLLPTVAIETTGCDVFNVIVGDPIPLPTIGEECYRYGLSYDVINWCMWDGTYEGYELPRLTENDGPDLLVEEAERPVVTYTSLSGLCVDRHHEGAGDSSLPDCDAPTLPNYGRYLYQQVVVVRPTAALPINATELGGPTFNCPNLTFGQFGDDDGDCQEEVSISFGTTCLDDVGGNLGASLLSAEVQLFAEDTNTDGQIDTNEFLAEEEVSASIVQNADGTYTFSGVYPIIVEDHLFHALHVVMEDGCGQQTEEIIEFSVLDCKAPAPICNNGLTVTLLPQPDGTHEAVLHARRLASGSSPISDCTGQGPDIFLGQPIVTQYAIYYASEVVSDPDFIPSPNDTTLVINETSDATTVVYLYAFDEAGNYDFCETYLLIQEGTSVDCEAFIDVSTPFIRRCFSNDYRINYFVTDDFVDEEMRITATFDPFLELVSADRPYTEISPGTYEFDLGVLDAYQYGQIRCEVYASCEAELGQTHCVEARLTPFACTDEQDYAELRVHGECDLINEEVRFTITNVGNTPMTAPRQVRIVEDVVMYTNEAPINLGPDASEQLIFPASGATWRVEVDQDDTFPYGGIATDFVEGCGGLMPGIPTQFLLSNPSPIIATDCQQNIGAYDPNDKRAFLRGYGDEHYIEANTPVEYMIRFQNTGTDTAFNVRIEDPVSPHLRLGSIVPGVSSHPYRVGVEPNGALTFYFDNIMLPDSNVNQEASNGFVKFTLDQRVDNPIGTVIENSANIFFDFNEPILTNTVFHTIGE